jgi:hypothetical protein
MYGNRLAGFGACYNMPSVAQPQAGAVPQIRCVEVADLRVARSGGRLTVQGFRIAGNMARDKEQKFRKRFVEPMHKNSLGQKLLQTVNAGPFPVSIAWGNDNFGFNGTIAMDRDRALDGRGSHAVIFLDEKAPDLNKLETVRNYPDVLLFHELIHAVQIQSGAAISNEKESEHRVIGIGDYTKCGLTENAYRKSRGLPFRCCWDRESL